MKKYSRLISIAAVAAMVFGSVTVPTAAEETAEITEDTVISASAVMFEASTKASAADFIYGDANGDGKVQADDAAAVLQKTLNSAYKMEIEDKTDEYLTVVDVDGDKSITAADSVFIMQKVLDGAFKFKVEGGSGELPTTVEESTSETTTQSAQGGASESTTAAESGSTEEAAAIELDIVLADGASTVSGAENASQYITVDNSTNVITVLSPGTYNFSGTLTNGQLVVNIDESYTDNNAEINFNGVSITNSSGPAIYGISGDIKLSAKKGTTNTLSDGTPAVFETETADDGTVTTTDEPDGCIFSHDGISLKGKGELIINGNYANGISGKDEVEVKNLTLTVNSVDNAIKAKDSVTVESGTLDLTSQKGNGIQCTKGDVNILDGSLTINAADKGIGAKAGNIVISGGTVNVTVLPSGTYDSAYNYDGIFAKVGSVTISGGDITVRAYCDGIQAETDLVISGTPTLNITTTGTINTADDISAKGLKSGTSTTLDGGTIVVESTDDSIHTDGDMTVNAADITVSSGDDGIHADGTLKINDGSKIRVLKSYEGVEGWYIYINGGEMSIYSSDDNINAAGGNDTTSTNQNRFGPNTGSTGYLEINGGYIYCENSLAMGDGVDSNGDLVINGGTVIVNGPTSDGDTAVDFGDNAQLYYNGGVLFAVGSSGMAESPSTGGKGYAVTYGVNGMSMGGPGGGFGGMSRPGQGSTSGTSVAAGTLLTLADANGNVVAALKVKVNTSAVILGSDSITSGTAYTLYSGGTYTGTLDENGYGTGGTISGGTKLASGTVTSAVTALTAANN